MKWFGFLDAPNLQAAFGKYGYGVDYVGLRDCLAGNATEAEAFIYLPISPYQPAEKRTGFVKHLGRHGFIVRTKIGKRRPNQKWKGNMDADLCCDFMRILYVSRPDLMVVASGDGDFVPLYREARSLGVRVEVAATKETVANEALEAASAFIDLGVLIQQQQLRFEALESSNGAAHR